MQTRSIPQVRGDEAARRNRLLEAAAGFPNASDSKLGNKEVGIV